MTKTEHHWFGQTHVQVIGSHVITTLPEDGRAMSAWVAYRRRLQGIEDRFTEFVFRRNRPGRFSNRALVAAVLESQWQRMNISKHLAAFDRALGRKA